MPAERPTIRRLPDQDCARRQSLEIATANSDLTVGFLRGIHLPRRHHKEAAPLRHVGEKIAMHEVVRYLAVTRVN